VTRLRAGAVGDLLSLRGGAPLSAEELAPGAMLLRGFAETDAAALVSAVAAVAASAPFRHMVTPGGYRMSVAMTNCGAAGWVTDRRGYRYSAIDPATDRPWPAMPPELRDLARRAAAAAGFDGFAPDSCLVNRYVPGTQLSLHQDRNERDYAAPIVSVSLGLPAVFLFGSLKRSDRPRRVPLASGDVVVWGGPSRLVFHGVAPLAEGVCPLTGGCRINLTLRRAL
jgi:alkylated DNA repair protein (DNA oxidative demethylase)